MSGNFEVHKYDPTLANSWCRICFFDFSNGEELSSHKAINDVFHVFHTLCIRDHLKRDPTCPICSKRVYIKVAPKRRPHPIIIPPRSPPVRRRLKLLSSGKKESQT